VERTIMESVELSLSRLNVKKVGCILLHCANDMTRHGSVVPETLKQLIHLGYTDIVGVSVYTGDEVAEMIENDLYQAIQIPMSLFDQRLIRQGLVRKLRDRSICVFVRSVFLQGLFFLDPDHMKNLDLERCASLHLRLLRRFAERAGMSVAQFAISYIRDIPGVTSLVLGADTPEQVLENIALIDGPEIDESIRSEAGEAFREVGFEAIMEALQKEYQRRNVQRHT
jgi:aryl-alcohol dehydrogenase-like predicted oxidoreductase